MTGTMKLRDLAERVFWTAVVSFAGALGGTELLGLDVSTLQAAGIAGITAGFNVVVAYGRQRLRFLPDPGAGLPGLPVSPPSTDTGSALPDPEA